MADCADLRKTIKARRGYKYRDNLGGPRRRFPLRATLAACLGILLAAAGLGLVFNLVMDQGIGPLPPEVADPLWMPVGLGQAWKLKQDGAILVDARDPGDYRAGRVRGALSLPPEEFDRYYPMLSKQLGQAKAIVVYGRSLSRWPAAWVAQELARRGHATVAVMEAGLDDWERAGYPMRKPRRRSGS